VQRVRNYVVVTALAGGSFLVTRVTIDLSDDRTHRSYPAAFVEVSGDMLHVWACDGDARLPLPGGARAPDPSTSDSGSSVDGSRLPPVSAEEAAAGGKRCAEGWSRFNAGELAVAKLDVEAALTVLERAVDERGLRSFGACLYNRGRIAEEEGDPEAARSYYRRSLAARPNDTVQARLDSLSE
jgi:tetratricopeptide (TPR) repeat protein